MTNMIKNTLKEFHSFIQRGNVIDLAVGIILGVSFQKIVSTLVNNVLMPPVGVLLGGADFSDLSLTIKKASLDTPAVTIGYGLFINTIIDFLIISLVVFFIVKFVNALYRKKPAEKSKKNCPECLMEIPKKAKRCGHCTTEF